MTEIIAGPFSECGYVNVFRKTRHDGLPPGTSSFSNSFIYDSWGLKEIANSTDGCYEAPFLGLPNRFHLGQAWSTAWPSSGVTVQVQAGGVDNVSVPYGTFPLSIRLDIQEIHTGGPTENRSAWFAPDLPPSLLWTDGATTRSLVWFKVGNNTFGTHP